MLIFGILFYSIKDIIIFIGKYLEINVDINTLSFSVKTKGFNDIIDITPNVQSLLYDSGFKEGSILIFVPGATAGITTIEYEPGLLKDYPKFMEEIIPSNRDYHHDLTWHDGNGYAHIRAALQGASFTVPFSGSQLLLGTWQQIILIDFDNRSRNRKIIVQIMGNI
jgi:secondary thiamine-phosphate synthase enzyme